MTEASKPVRGLPTRIEQLFTGDVARAYAIGKGHLAALDVPTVERPAGG